MSPWNRIVDGPRWHIILGVFAVWWIIALIGNRVPLACAQDAERVERFLARLGLVDLQTLQIERMLESTGPPGTQRQLARRLADLYAERLMASSDDKTRYDDTVRRIRSLTSRYPEANTTALQVMLLQADYNRAESQIAAWINNPQDDVSRREATSILSRITPLLITHQEAIRKQVEELLAEIDKLEDADLLATRERELQRQESVAARATYFAAWSNYYLALVTQAEPKAEPYIKARDTFRQLLGFDESLPADTEAEWLGLESIWRSRALIGLGLSEAACSDVDACDLCFRLLEHSSVPAQIKDQAPYWYVRALFSAGELQKAESYSREQITAFKPPATQGQVSFCVALVREGFGNSGVSPSKPRQELGQLGLTGLARLGQLGALKTLIDTYKIQGTEDAGFVLLWARGQQQFADAEKSKSNEQFAVAATTLLDALRSQEANSLTGPASRCRYTLAWCHYRQGKYEEAAREFTNAITGLRATEDLLAVEAAWMAFVAYRRLIEDRPRFVAAASAALQRVQRDYPDHPYARRAKYELARLLENTDPEEMTQRLEKIPPTDDNYLSAQYDLCLLWHRRWSKDKENGRLAAERFQALKTAVDRYLSAASSETDFQRKVKCCLLAGDAGLRTADAGQEVVGTYLDRAAPWTGELPENDPLLDEYHFRRLELATMQGDESLRRQHAQWLVDHASGSPYELAALMIVANAVDREISATATPSGALRNQAYSAFQRLGALLGDSPKVLSWLEKRARGTLATCPSRG